MWKSRAGVQVVAGRGCGGPWEDAPPLGQGKGGARRHPSLKGRDAVGTSHSAQSRWE